jgi:hypothetical protein
MTEVCEVIRFATASGWGSGESDHTAKQQRLDSMGRQNKKRAGGLWFLLLSMLPTTALFAFVLALFATGVPADPPRWEALRHWVQTLDLAEIALMLLVVVVASAILSPLQLSIVRMLEGYWGESFVARLLSGIGVGLQRRRLERLQRTLDQPAYSLNDAHHQDMAASKLEAYPDASLLLPTRLGNALRAAEAQAGQRYGLETVTVWPRLHVVLSDRMEETLADLRDQLDIAARLCAVLLLATLISAGLLFPYGWWLLVPAATALLAWLAYQAAVQAAISYGEQIYVAFDLHRFDMLRGLHLPLPRNPREELEFNQQLSEFLRDRIPGEDDLAIRRFIRRYDHASGLGRPSRMRSGRGPLLLGFLDGRFRRRRRPEQGQ